MDDRSIVELFLSRSEEALLQTTEKYGRYCHRIAYNILGNDEDSEECVNDALMRVWGSIPPNEPNSLSSFIGKITRRSSSMSWLSVYRAMTSWSADRIRKRS